jgi:hypothetical protein
MDSQVMPAILVIRQSSKSSDSIHFVSRQPAKRSDS